MGRDFISRRVLRALEGGAARTLGDLTAHLQVDRPDLTRDQVRACVAQLVYAERVVESGRTGNRERLLVITPRGERVLARRTTSERVTVLLRTFSTLSTRQVALALGRDPVSVQTHMHQLDIPDLHRERRFPHPHERNRRTTNRVTTFYSLKGASS